MGIEETFLIDGNLRLCKINGINVYLIEGVAFDEETQKTKSVSYGLFQSDLGKYADRGQFTALAQFFSLVVNGLVAPRHIFKGLNRPLLDDDNIEADKNKLIHSRKPGRDYKWKDGSANDIVDIGAPDGCVYVIIISKNIKHADSFPMVYGWIDRWNWVDEDKGLADSPRNWASRYGERIYTKE